MPVLDTKRGVLVVRIVYDGPPLSGKTTSLRSLARGLGVPVTTPGERDGRTLFFDWVDYIGGLYEGRQIRCQIVSVPGQEQLAARRKELLTTADAVVLVADTRRKAMPSAVRVLQELLPYCRSQDPPIGVVLQANKRDAVDSVPRDELQEELGRVAPLAIVETVATAGDGIREAFVFAVRLALDRVRAFTGQLPEGEPEITTPDDLMERLRALEVQSLPPEPEPEAAPSERPRALGPANTMRPPALLATPEAIVAAVPCDAEDEVYVDEDVDDQLDEPPTKTMPPIEASLAVALDQEIALLSAPRPNSPPGELLDEEPFVPDPMMPGGFIWPPVDGRVLLHEVAELGVVPVRTARGDWWASGRGCLFHSAKSAIYPSADRGRQALIEWARLHATNIRCLSSGRTVVLASAGGGRLRLWQLIRAEQALRERLATSLALIDPAQLATDLIEAAAHLVQARIALHTPELRLPCTLWTISGDLKTQPRFVGLMPEVGQDAPEEPRGSDLITRELTPLFRALVHQRDDVPAVIEALSNARDRRSDTATGLAQLLQNAARQAGGRGGAGQAAAQRMP
jgi:signal recognition particle receptor subunit beta